MVIRRDRWPALLTREQEDVLMSAGFHYDSHLGVLVNPKLRKVLAVEAAAEQGVSELRSFVSKRSAQQAEIVFDVEVAPGFR